MDNFAKTVNNFLNSNSNFLDSLKNMTNYDYTENGGIKHKTTQSALLDMFGQGGSMRNRSEEDIITMFKKAYKENSVYTLKCLFYLRDCRGGAGERRFFRVCMNWLAKNDKNAVLRNMKYIPDMGRWDDLYTFVDTPCEEAAFNLIKEEITNDLKSYNNL